MNHQEEDDEMTTFFSFLKNLDLTQQIDEKEIKFKDFLHQCLQFQTYPFTKPLFIEMRQNLLLGNEDFKNNYLLHLTWFLKSLQRNKEEDVCETLLNIFNIFHSPLSQLKKEKTQLVDIYGTPFENIKNNFNYRVILKMTNLDKDITNRNHVMRYIESNDYQLKCKKPLTGKIYSNEFLKVIDNMNANPNEVKQIACIVKTSDLSTMFNVEHLQEYVSKNLKESGEHLLNAYDRIVCGLVKTSFSTEYYNNFHHLINTNSGTNKTISNCEKIDEFKNLYFYPAFLKFRVI